MNQRPVINPGVVQPQQVANVTSHHSLENTNLVNGQFSPINGIHGSQQFAQVSGSNVSFSQSSSPSMPNMNTSAPVYQNTTPSLGQTVSTRQNVTHPPPSGQSAPILQSTPSSFISTPTQHFSAAATQPTNSQLRGSHITPPTEGSKSNSGSLHGTPTYSNRMHTFGTGTPNKLPESVGGPPNMMPSYSAVTQVTPPFSSSAGPLYSTRSLGGTVPTSAVFRGSMSATSSAPVSSYGAPPPTGYNQVGAYSRVSAMPGPQHNLAVSSPHTPSSFSSSPSQSGSTHSVPPGGQPYSTSGVMQSSPSAFPKPQPPGIQGTVPGYSPTVRGQQPPSYIGSSAPPLPTSMANISQPNQYSGPYPPQGPQVMSNIQGPVASTLPPSSHMGRHPGAHVPPLGNMNANNYSPMGNRYPPVNNLQQGMGRLSVSQQGFNKLWGVDTIDLLQCRNILPPVRVDPPPIRLHQEFLESDNCSPDIFRCTLNKIPESNSLLQKSRLPLGILIHPFRDLSQLAVIQCSTIVRCRACRTYINPFVYFIDNKRWKCNLCFRANELPDEFQYDPVSKTYGDPTRRPEVKSATIEFIAPSEYMLRPPQPAIYLFVLDVSRIACETGYLETLSTVLLEELDNLPGDSRTQIGFILFDSYVHFFSIADNYNQAHEMIVTDIEDVFLPSPDSLLVNLNENRSLIKDLLEELPRRYNESFDTNSALGSALQAAYKLMSPTGGRITVFQSCLPNIGPGSLNSREDPNQRSAKEVHHLGPQTDFYKRLSLDCSTQQISVDLFLINAQYSDLATLSGISQFSGGCVYHFPLFRKQVPEANEKLTRSLRRYLTRKIGFEAVMRIRCSRGLSIHTFHGNFFVRSTDLLSLPNVNPDAGFGMQVSIEETLSELQCVCFQAALLYTSAKGERRIRVHTLCLPVTTSLSDVLTSADQQCIIGLLSKMAVDRSLKSSVSDAREAFINVAVDVLSAYKLVETAGGHSGLLAPNNLALIPLYILALLKSVAFRTGQSTRLDDRVFAMLQMKTLPLRELIQSIHCDLYNVTALDDKTDVEFDDKPVPQPPRLTLSSEQIDSRGSYILDTPDVTYFLIGRAISPTFLNNIFGVTDIKDVSENLSELPELDNEDSKKLRHFINYLQSEKPWSSVLKVVIDIKQLTTYLITDRTENSLSYYEFLNHIKAQVK